MNAKMTDYLWLTSPLLARDEFLGTGEGTPLPHGLRHGAIIYNGLSGTSPFTDSEIIAAINAGRFNCYLAAVDEGGRSLDLNTTFFLPRMVLARVLVISSDKLTTLRQLCNLEASHVVALPRNRVFAHCWNYRLSNDPKSDQLYLDLYKALDVDELPGDYDIVRLLCERFPYEHDLPDMYLILPPNIVLRNGERKWQQDDIHILLKAGSAEPDAQGRMRLLKEYVESKSLLAFEGFLMPLEAGELFKTDDESRTFPILSCKKAVKISAES